MHRRVFVLLLAALATAGPAYPQVLLLKYGSFASAGSASTGSPLRLGMSAGQSIAGFATHATVPAYIAGEGFWHWTGHMPVLSIPDPAPDAPVAFALYPNTPNPFARATTIRYAIPAASGGVPVSLRIFDLSGRLVRTLDSGRRDAGVHTAHWDGADGVGHALGGGIYFCRITAGPFAATRRLVLTH